VANGDTLAAVLTCVGWRRATWPPLLVTAADDAKRTPSVCTKASSGTVREA